MIKSLQTDPPNFGDAKFVNSLISRIIIWWRRKKTLNLYSSFNDYGLIKNKISIVVLSCKRLKSLKRLVNSLNLYLSNIEQYNNYELILIDNGSGDELINWAKNKKFFHKIYELKKNIGMCSALNKIYSKLNSEYTMLIEDDFEINYDKPFLENCLKIFDNFPEIGIIRLKNQNNWGKKFRRIGPLRKIENIFFWTWFPSFNYRHNVWCAGSVIFRHLSYKILGPIQCGDNISRSYKKHQGIYYEEIFGKKFNKIWLAAKIYNCYPFVQLDQQNESPGWNEK